jgi:SAM-dependent methyltransferase
MAAAGEQWSSAFASAGLDAARVYDTIMVPVMFEPWADLLLDQLELAAGEVLLDVACGTGSLTRRAAARIGRSGRVTGCDVSPAMLAVARAKPADDASAIIDFVECPAEALTVDSAAYDVATCQHGMQFFGNRQGALQEMRRAMRPGGRFGIAVWCAIDECPPFAVLATAIAKVLGDETANAYRNGPWGLAGTDVAALVAQAGFSNVRTSRHQLPVTFGGGPPQLAQTLVASGVAARVAALDDPGQKALLAELARQTLHELRAATAALN